MRETWVQSLGQEDPLEEEMATCSSTLAWKIPWTEEPGRLQSMGSQRVRDDWTTSLHFTSDIRFNFCDLDALIWYMSRLLYQPHEVVWELTEITYKVSSAIPSIKCVHKSIDHRSSQKGEEKLVSYAVWRPELGWTACYREEDLRSLHVNL